MAATKAHVHPQVRGFFRAWLPINLVGVGDAAPVLALDTVDLCSKALETLLGRLLEYANGPCFPSVEAGGQNQGFNRWIFLVGEEIAQRIQDVFLDGCHCSRASDEP